MAHPPARTAAAARPCFTIALSDAGDWIARERSGGAEHHFASRKAALRFVLFDRGAPGAALVAPPRARKSA